MKTITFLLPAIGRSPSGGAKVVYEYANRLVADGFCVNIIYPSSLFFQQNTITQKFRCIARYFYCTLTRKYKPYSWFELDKRVKLFFIWSLNESFLPKTDICVATAIETSEYLAKYKRVLSKDKFYLVQGYESWNVGEKRFLASLRLELRKITISPYLKEIIESQGQKTTLIENGFDFDYFKMTFPIAKKNKYCIVMLFHTHKLKGVADGLKALEIVKGKFSELKVNLFGTYSRPKEIPEWMNYYQNPDKVTHNRIYNEAAIFVGPSLSEGFCLTPPEAMQCGCAVACTDIGGYTVICKNGRNSLISPVSSPESLATNIIRLIEDDALRYKIAETGHQDVKQYTWERAYAKFKREIERER